MACSIQGDEFDRSLNPSQVPLYLGAGLLLAGTIAMTFLSPHVQSATKASFTHYAGFVFLYMAWGAVFVALLWWMKKRLVNSSWWLLVGVGLAMRGIAFFSVPIVEDDYYRYLWDGAVTAAGENPYATAPSDVMEKNHVLANIETVPQTQKASKDVLSKINHPRVKTIYPPVAQAAFALAYSIYPYSITGLRAVYLVFDIVTLLILCTLLLCMKKKMWWVVVYWWNPLVVKELFNAVHMDVLLFPFLLAALGFVLQRRYIWTTVMIVLAVGVKLWPIVFVGFVAMAIWREKIPVGQRLKQSGYALGVLSVGLGLLAWPIVSGELTASSGFVKYTVHWRNNDALFRLFYHGVDWGYTHLAIRSSNPYQVTRVLVAALFLLFVGWLQFRQSIHRQSMTTQWLVVIAALFLLSPTQFPWYATWFLPLLVLRPWWPLLLYVPLLPLYYWQHWLSAHGDPGWFDNGIVWVEHGPVLAAIVYGQVWKRRCLGESEMK